MVDFFKLQAGTICEPLPAAPSSSGGRPFLSSGGFCDPLPSTASLWQPLPDFSLPLPLPSAAGFGQLVPDADAADTEDPYFIFGQPVAQAEEPVRAGFVRKVYSLVAVQLVTTALIATPFALTTADQLSDKVGIFYCASFVSVAMLLGVSCQCREMSRRVPYNYILLFVLTACEGVVVGFVSSIYTLPSVILAVSMTAAIFASLTVYALCSNTDFTKMAPTWRPYLFALCEGLAIFGLLCWSVGGVFMQKVYAGLGAVLFSFYIIFDTQMIVKGRHHSRYSYSIDDYVFAALSIYLDVINSFLFLLELLGHRR